MRVKCPLCNQWIAYPHKGQRHPNPAKHPKLFKRRKQDRDYVYKALLFHLGKDHLQELRQLFPGTNRCPICDFTFRGGMENPAMGHYRLAQHVVAKHKPELLRLLKDRLGVDFSPEALEWQEEPVDVVEQEKQTIDRQEQQATGSQPEEGQKTEQEVFSVGQETKTAASSGQETPEKIVIEDVPPRGAESQSPPIELPASGEGKTPPSGSSESTATEGPRPSGEPSPREEPGGERPPEEAKQTEEEKEEEVGAQGDKLAEFEHKPLLEFLAERIQPFHVEEHRVRHRKAVEKAEAKGEKREKKRRSLSLYLLGMAVVGVVGYGIFRYIQAKKQAAQNSETASQAQEQPAATANPGSGSEANPAAQGPPPGPHVGPDGRFYSSRWSNKVIY